MMVVQAADYYVAGSMNGWNTTNSANKMSKVSGNIYSKTFSALEATGYQFKVSTYNWGSDWGGGVKDNTLSNVTLSGDGNGNISFTLSTTSDVTFYFDDGNTKKIYVQATPALDSWTVAGSNKTLFGTTWTPGNNVNDMALVGELYTWSKEDVTLGASTIEFKVCKNHAWDEAYPSSNYELSIPEDGIYDITITFNEDSKTVNATATKKGSAVVIPTIKLHGTFTGNWEDTEEFVIASGNATASLTLTNVPIGSYDFGVKIDGSWTSNGSSYTREEPSHQIIAGSGDCAFYADRNGDYTFTWIYETNTLEITYPAIYTIAGSSTAFVSDWDPADATNDMAFNGTLFTWQKEDVSLEDNVELKVCLDHGWGTAWPASNYIISISETAKYTVTVTYNPSSNEVVASAEKTGEAGPVAPATYTVAGSSTAFGSNWNPEDENNDMELVGELYTLVKENVALNANVEFKVCKNHGWGNAWPTNNYVLAIPENAIYKITVTFNESTKEVAAVAEKTGEPEPDWITVREGLELGRHYTVCLEKEVVNVKGATFWSLTYKNEAGTLAYLEEEIAPFEAGKPYIFQATADKLEVVYEGDAVGAPVANGALRGTFSYMDANALAAVEGNVYMLFSNELRPIGNDNHLDAHRAYVLYNLLQPVPAAGFAPGKKVKGMPMHKDVTTGFENIEASEKPMKLMINGNIYILRGEKMYDATGRMVK